MSGIERFQGLGVDQRVTESIDELGEKKIDQESSGSLLGRPFRALTRSRLEQQENNKVTQSFFSSLRKAYGDRVTDWAIKGYEDRVNSGKPLTGYRIQQIIERANTAKAKDDQALDRLVRERAPVLLDQALERAGLEWPVGIGDEWRTVLEKLVEREVRKSEKFEDSKNLETSDFNHEFAPVGTAIVNKYRDAILNIGAFEDREELVLQQIRDGNAPVPEGGNWGRARAQEVQRCFFPRGQGTDNYRTQFLEGFGQGEGKVGTIDEYFQQKVLPRAQKKFEDFFGKCEPERLLTYEGFRSDKGNNGAFSVDKQSLRPFYDVVDMREGMTTGGRTRPEKFHISVPPEHMEKAFEAIAPILLREDSPIKMWKLVDVENALSTYTKAQGLLEEFDKEVERLESENQPMAPEEIGTKRKALDEKVQEAKRLYDSCQFTLYLTNGKDEDGKIVGPSQDGGDVSKILLEIERALTSAGIPSCGTPGSDEPVGKFVSYRQDRITLLPEDPGYTEARKRAGIKDGQPVEIDLDPKDPNYETYRTKLRENPHYKAQIGVSRGVCRDEVVEMRKTLGGMVGSPPSTKQEIRDFLKIAGEVNQLGKVVERLEPDLTFEQWTVLDDDEKELHATLQDLIAGHFGITEETPVQMRTTLMSFAGSLPEIGELLLESSRPGRIDDPRMLERLQVAWAGFVEIKQNVQSLGNVPQGTRDYLQFVEDELRGLLSDCHTAQGTPNVSRLVSDVTHGLIQGAPVHDSIQRYIDILNDSTVDQELKAQIGEVLTLAGRIIARSTDPDVPMDARLRMSTELESLSLQFRELNASIIKDVDGQDPIWQIYAELGTVDHRLTMDMGDIVGKFTHRETGQNVPTDRGRETGEALRNVGRLLELVDKGQKPTTNWEIDEARGYVSRLTRFFETYRPSEDFESSFIRLRSEVQRLHDSMAE